MSQNYVNLKLEIGKVMDFYKWVELALAESVINRVTMSSLLSGVIIYIKLQQLSQVQMLPCVAEIFLALLGTFLVHIVHSWQDGPKVGITCLRRPVFDFIVIVGQSKKWGLHLQYIFCCFFQLGIGQFLPHLHV